MANDNNREDNNNKDEAPTSDENLSTSNENTDDTVKENEVPAVEPEKLQETESSINVGSSIGSVVHVIKNINDDESLDESSVKSNTYEFPTPPPPICNVPPNSFEVHSFEIPPDLISDTINDNLYNQASNDEEDDAYPREYIVTFDEDPEKELQRRGSCLSRGGSRSSIKKKVNYNDSTEVIPPGSIEASRHEEEENDDSVFSDSVPPKLPRGDMCTPFFTKRGSIPGLAALPDWFREEK